MEYKEFVDKVANDLREFLPEHLQGAAIKSVQVDKLQHESYYGISVQPEDSNVGLNLDLQDAYEKVEAGMRYDVAMVGIAASVSDNMQSRPHVNLDELMNYDAMKERLMVQVVPIEGNEEKLSNMPHQILEDMAVVYRFLYAQNDQQMQSIVVTNDMLQNYGITAKQLHEDAMANAMEKFPASIRSMQEIMAEMMGLDVNELPPMDTPMFVATCNDGINGAGCIFYPNFMEQAKELFAGDFFILPSSTHEVIMIPANKDMSFHELEDMVQTINAEQVAPKDRLSNSVYHYDATDKIFEKAANYEKRMQEKEKMQQKGSLLKKLGEKKKEAAGLAEKRDKTTKAKDLAAAL